MSALNNVCKTKVDFPLPDTPVTHVNVPIGILRSAFCRLFPVAPKISKNLPFFAVLLFLGNGMNFFPER